MGMSRKLIKIVMGSYHRSTKTNIPQNQIHDGSFYARMDLNHFLYFYLCDLPEVVYARDVEMYKERDSRQQQHIHTGLIELEDSLMITLKALTMDKHDI